MDRFEELLDGLGKEIGAPLHPDEHGACLITVDHDLRVQLECDRGQEKLFIVSALGELAPGRFREILLREALLANNTSYDEGILAYSTKTHDLVLYSTLPVQELNGEKLAQFLLPFLGKAETWRLRILHG